MLGKFKSRYIRFATVFIVAALNLNCEYVANGFNMMVETYEIPIRNVVFFGNSAKIAYGRDLTAAATMYTDSGFAALGYTGIQHSTRAFNFFNRAVQLDPKHIRAYLGLAEVCRKEELYDCAIERYGKVIQFDRDHATEYSALAYYHRGIIHFNNNSYDEAIADFTLLADHNHAQSHHLAFLYFNRGLAHLEKGDYDQAIADFDRQIEKNPNNANDYNRRGQAYLKKGNFDKAIADYETALRINPNHRAAKQNLQQVRDERRRLTQERANAFLRSGLEHFTNNDFDKAIEHLGIVLQLNPNHAQAKLYLKRAQQEKLMPPH